MTHINAFMAPVAPVSANNKRAGLRSSQTPSVAASFARSSRPVRTLALARRYSGGVMPPEIAVRTSSNPLARLHGEWEIVVDGTRTFGPDTLAACLEALPWVRSAFAEDAATTN